MHLNIQSLRNKGPQIDVFINTLEESFKPQIICLTEHWLTSIESKMKWITGYSIISSFCRKDIGYGGSCILIKDSLLEMTKSKDALINISEVGQFECAVSEVNFNMTPVLLISLYRPPRGNIQQFFDKLDLMLAQVLKNNLNKNIVLCGDLNIDYSVDNSEKQQLLNILTIYNLENKLKEYTHISSKNASAIDYVISHKNIQVVINNIDLGLSDHCAQLFKVLINTNNYTKQKITGKKARNYSSDNYSNFKCRLADEKWLEINDMNDVNINYNKFLKTFLLYFEESFPYIVKPRSKHNLTATKPEWISRGIIISSKNLKYLYKQSKVIEDTKFIEYYKNYKKIYRKVVKAAKKQYTSNKIKNCINRPQELWKIINNTIGNSNLKDSEKIKIKVDDELITSVKEIANVFNNHYINISNKLNPSSIAAGKDAQGPNLSLLNKVDQQLILYPTTESEIAKTISSLKNKKSQDIHGLSSYLIKSCGKHLLKPLKTLINQSFKQGIFPDRLKAAKIIPIYKKGDRLNLANYRPISLLPIFSKIFEKILYNRLSQFLGKNNIICREQSGFQKNKSTMTTVFQLTTTIAEALDKGDQAFGIFCDLSKAFDLVDHNILLNKLSDIGIASTALNLIKSYLHKRTQIVEIGQNSYNEITTSDWETIKTGVPQGSILGPLLFLIYINDLPECVNYGKLTLFADDTSILLSDKSVITLKNISEITLITLETWFLNNKLVLNFDKTQFIQFSKRNKPIEQILNTHNSTIREIAVVKFLGLHIDNQLTWKDHIRKLENKLSSICYMLRALKLILDLKTLKMVYYAYFHSVMLYGVEFWGNATNSIKIFRMQKKAIRIIFGIKPRSSCRPYFKTHKIRTLYTEYTIRVLKLVNKNAEYYSTNKDLHSHNTRNAYKLRSIQHNSSLFGKTLFYMGLKMYNQLPKHVSSERNVDKFGNLLNKIFENQYFYDIQEVNNYIQTY